MACARRFAQLPLRYLALSEQVSNASRTFFAMNHGLRFSKWRLPCAQIYRENLARPSTENGVKFSSTMAVQKEIEKDTRCVFVGGLQPGTVEETLNSYFTKFGEVENIRLMKTFLGYSRNYGFVMFKEQLAAHEVLNQNHVINGKEVSVGRSRNFRVIYVGGLPSHFTEDTIVSHFSKFGKVDSVKFIDNPKLGAKTGYAFVTFETPEEAKFASEEDVQEILGNLVKVRPRSGTTGEELIAKVRQSKKLMVRGLDLDTTVEELQDYFERFGDLRGIDLLINAESRVCAAVVFFRNLEDIQNVCQESVHPICNAHATVMQIPDQEKQNIREKTIYVENLPEEVTDYDLKKYFKTFGHVAKVVLLVDKETGKSKGSGVVKLRSPNTVSRIMECPEHYIGKREIKVRRRGIKIRPHLNTDELSVMDFTLSLSSKQ